MALLAFAPEYQYPQFTVVAYILACSSPMVVFVACNKLVARLLRTYDMDETEHSRAVTASISATFSTGMVLGALCGGALVQNLGFNRACRVQFYALLALPVIVCLPFHPCFMKGKALHKDVPEKKRLGGDVENRYS